jgi:hypothetical protein
MTQTGQVLRVYATKWVIMPERSRRTMLCSRSISCRGGIWKQWRIYTSRMEIRTYATYAESLFGNRPPQIIQSKAKLQPSFKVFETFMAPWMVSPSLHLCYAPERGPGFLVFAFPSVFLSSTLQQSWIMWSFLSKA